MYLAWIQWGWTILKTRFPDHCLITDTFHVEIQCSCSWWNEHNSGFADFLTESAFFFHNFNLKVKVLMGK